MTNLNNILFSKETNTSTFTKDKQEATKLLTAIQTLLKGCKSKGINVNHFKDDFKLFEQFIKKSPGMVVISLAAIFKEIRNSKKNLSQEFIENTFKEKLDFLKVTESKLGTSFADGAKTFQVNDKKQPEIILELKKKQQHKAIEPKKRDNEISFQDLIDAKYPIRIFIRGNGETKLEEAKNNGAGSTHNISLSSLENATGVHLLKDGNGKLFLSNIKQFNANNKSVTIIHDGNQEHHLKANELAELKINDRINIGEDNVEIVLQGYKTNGYKLHVLGNNSDDYKEFLIKEDDEVKEIGATSNKNEDKDLDFLAMLEEAEDPFTELDPIESFRIPSKSSQGGSLEISQNEILGILEEIDGLSDDAIVLRAAAIKEPDANDENSFVSEMWIGADPRNLMGNNTANFTGDEITTQIATSSTTKIHNLGNYRDINRAPNATVVGDEGKISQPISSIDIPSCNRTVSGLHCKLRLDTKGNFWVQNNSKSKHTYISSSINANDLHATKDEAPSNKFKKLEQGQYLHIGAARIGIDPENRRFFIYAPNNVTGNSADENYYYYTLNEHGIPELSKVGKFDGYTDIAKDFFSPGSVKKNLGRILIGEGKKIFQSVFGKFSQLKDDISKK